MKKALSMSWLIQTPPPVDIEPAGVAACFRQLNMENHKIDSSASKIP